MDDARRTSTPATLTLLLLLAACGRPEAPPAPAAPAAAPAAQPSGEPPAPGARRQRGGARAPAGVASAPPGGVAGPALAAAPPAPPAPLCGDPGEGPEPDMSRLRAFVRKRAGTVRDCYQRELKRDSNAGGKATVQFTIGTCGEVSGVAVVARSGRVDGAAACVTRAMRGWRTPFRPAEPVTVEYPFSFSASM